MNSPDCPDDSFFSQFDGPPLLASTDPALLASTDPPDVLSSSPSGDFRRRFLVGTRFDGDFSNANFSGACLTSANFIHTSSLRGADFRGAQVANAMFAGADLTQADFRGILMNTGDFPPNFEGANLLGAKFSFSFVARYPLMLTESQINKIVLEQ